MKKWGVIALGVLFNIIGIVWILQGLDILGGSFMSGDITWTFIGFVVLVIGDAMIILTVWPKSKSSD